MGKKKAMADFMLLLMVVAVVAAIVLIGEFAFNNIAGLSGIISIRGKLHIYMLNDDIGTELVSLLKSKSGDSSNIELLGIYAASGDKIGEASAAIIEPMKNTMDSAYAHYDFTFTGGGGYIKYSKNLPQEIQDITGVQENTKEAQEKARTSILDCPPSFQSVSDDMKKKITASLDNGVMVWPTVSKVLTSGFGGRVLEKKPTTCNCHGGIDIAGKNEDVYAAAEGNVVFAGDLTSKGFGNLVVIGHPVFQGVVSAGHPEEYEFYTYYAHLSSISVSAGQEVIAGKVIGKTGNTGNVEGTNGGYHLHFQIGTSEFPKDSTAIDPCGFLDLTGTTGLKCEHEQVAACAYVTGTVSGKSVRSYETDIPIPGAKSGDARGAIIFKQWD